MGLMEIEENNLFCGLSTIQQFKIFGNVIEKVFLYMSIIAVTCSIFLYRISFTFMILMSQKSGHNS